MSDHSADLDRLPFTVAFPLHHALDENAPAGDRVQNAIFAAYQIMRTTALLLLAEYLEDGRQDDRVAARVQSLRQPHWQEWIDLTTVLAEAATRAGPGGERTSFGPLVAGWSAIRRAPPPALAEAMAGVATLRGFKAPSAVLLVQQVRNDRAHRHGTFTPDCRAADLRLIGALGPMVLAMAREVFPPGAVTIYRSAVGSDEVIRLEGPHPDRKFEVERAPSSLWDALDRSPTVAALPGRTVPLWPLFVATDAETHEHEVGAGGLLEEAAMVDAASERQVTLLSVRRAWADVPLAAHLARRLADRAIALGLGREHAHRWMVQEFARMTTEAALGELRDGKYLPECYLVREHPDGALRAALADGGRAVLVLGDAGTGKSSLLARLAEDLLAAGDDGEVSTASTRRRVSSVDNPARYLALKGTGDVVVLLHGPSAYAGPSILTQHQLLGAAVSRRLGIREGVFSTLTDLLLQFDATSSNDTQPERRVWLLFDAINEATRFLDVVAAIDEVLPLVRRLRWLRIVVSMREGAFEALRGGRGEIGAHGGDVFVHESCLAVFEDGSGRPSGPCLRLRLFSVQDAAHAYAMRAAALPELACRASWDTLPPATRALLCKPLMLHLFHATFAGERAPRAMASEGALLDAFLDEVCHRMRWARSKLEELGALLLDRRRGNEVPAEWAADVRAAFLATVASAAERVAKLDPVEELLAANVLGRRHDQGYQFTSQRLCEQVILRELRRRSAPAPRPSPVQVSALAALAAGGDGRSMFEELSRALGTLAAEAVVAADTAWIRTAVDIDDSAVRAVVLRAALCRIAECWGPDPAGDAAPRAALEAIEAACLESPDRAVGLAGLLVGSAGPGDYEAGDPRTEDDGAEAHDAGDGGVQLYEHLHRNASAVAGHLGQLVARGLRAHPEVAQRADLQLQIGRALDQQARARGDAGHAAESLALCREAWEHCSAAQRLAPGDPLIAEELVISSAHLASAHRSMGHYPEARRLLDEVVALRARAVAEAPSMRNRRLMAAALTRLGVDHALAGENRKARDLYTRALDMRIALIEEWPGQQELEWELSVTLVRLGALALKRRAFDEASVALARADALRTEIAHSQPWRMELRQDLAFVRVRAGWLLARTGGAAIARGIFEQELEVALQFHEREPYHVGRRRQVASLYYFVAMADLAEGHLDEARTALLRALRLRGGMHHARRRRAVPRRDLSAALATLAVLDASVGRLRTAHAAIRWALEVLPETLDGRQPRGWVRQRAFVEVAGALVDLARGDTATALGRLEATVATYGSRGRAKAGLRRLLWDHLAAMRLTNGNLAGAQAALGELRALGSDPGPPVPTLEVLSWGSESVPAFRFLWMSAEPPTTPLGRVRACLTRAIEAPESERELVRAEARRALGDVVGEADRLATVFLRLIIESGGRTQAG